MKANDLPTLETASGSAGAAGPETDGSLLAPLLAGAASTTGDGEGAPHEAAGGAWHGVFLGELLALEPDQGRALVRCPAVNPQAALRARATVDLHGAHIGREVTLVFAQGSAAHPIVTGVLRGQPGWPLPEAPAQVQADGERLVVQAKEQLVLRCGKASITLTRAGKVLVEGTYLSSRSSGVNRVKGGSVQLN